jgi:hypothetical protein
MKDAKKKWLGLICLILIPSLSWSLEIELSISTELMPDEIQVFKASQVISKAIEAGKNEEASAEAFVECPEDNAPKFTVTSIRLNSVWLMNAKSFADKQYSGLINYVLTCQHNRHRGGDR